MRFSFLISVLPIALATLAYGAHTNEGQPVDDRAKENTARRFLESLDRTCTLIMMYDDPVKTEQEVRDILCSTLEKPVTASRGAAFRISIILTGTLGISQRTDRHSEDRGTTACYLNAPRVHFVYRSIIAYNKGNIS